MDEIFHIVSNENIILLLLNKNAEDNEKKRDSKNGKKKYSSQIVALNVFLIIFISSSVELQFHAFGLFGSMLSGEH